MDFKEARKYSANVLKANAIECIEHHFAVMACLFIYFFFAGVGCTIIIVSYIVKK